MLRAANDSRYSNYTPLTTVNLHYLHVDMDQSTASDALLAVAAGSSARHTRSQSRTRESSLSELPPSPAQPPSYIGSSCRVHFKDTQEEAVDASTSITPRSTRGKAPARLVDEQTLPQASSRQVTAKRQPTKQRPQPPSNKVSAARKLLFNATKTLGKKRMSNTSRKTKIQALTPQVQPVNPSTSSAPTSRHSTTTNNKVTKVSKATQKAIEILHARRVSSNSAPATTTSPIVAIVPFKLLYDTRWNYEKLSDADTTLASSNKPWLEVLQELNNTAIPVLEGRRIALFYTWKVRVTIASTGARGVRQTEVVTLLREQEGAERWKKAMDLVRSNSQSSMKELSVTIESIWTPDGLGPAADLPPAYEASTPQPQPQQSSQNRHRRSERSEAATNRHIDDRALFWSSIQDYWNCKGPLRCPIKARHGLACFISHGCHYEVIFHVAQHWREAFRRGEDTLESPSRRIRELIMRSHEKQ
jgi:hypothetical protein